MIITAVEIAVQRLEPVAQALNLIEGGFRSLLLVILLAIAQRLLSLLDLIAQVLQLRTNLRFGRI